MRIHGRERPKYTSSCIANDMMPVARTSFCIHAYQAAHSLSATLRWALYLETSLNWLQYVPEDNTVEFLRRKKSVVKVSAGDGPTYIMRSRKKKKD